MNKDLIRKGYKVAKRALIVAVLILFVGIIVSGIGIAQADVDGNIRHLSAFQVHEHNLGFFESGTDMQIAISGSFTNKVDNRFDSAYNDNFLEIVVLFSNENTFSDPTIAFQETGPGLVEDFSSEGGFYKVIVTNLSVHEIIYFVVEAHSSTGGAVAIVIGLVLIGFGMTILSIIAMIFLIVILILGVLSLYEILKETKDSSTKN